MNSFEFGRPVKISGEVYYITSDMERLSKIMKQQVKMIQKKDATESEIKMGCKIATDAALGKGAFDKIFGDRKFLVNDATMLFVFITNEINVWKAELKEVAKDKENLE